jgi:hypothetical protein
VGLERGAHGERRGKRSLAKILQNSKGGVLRTVHAVDIALDVCDALATAHEHGIIHGQLGLACVRLVYTAELGPRDVEIFDLAAPTPSELNVGAALAFHGPEQRRGGSTQSTTDIWAFGALLYTMLAGKPPATAAAAAPGVPRGLALIMTACLADEPAKRPQAITDIQESLAVFSSDPASRLHQLAERRARQRNLEQRGLEELPSVLDKLDDAAFERASHETTTVTSLLLATSTEQAVEEFIDALHEQTDSVRMKLASRPSLIDFDDDDDEIADPFRAAVRPQASVHVSDDPPLGFTSPFETPPLPPSVLIVGNRAPAAFRSRGEHWGKLSVITLATAIMAGSLSYVGSALLEQHRSALPAAETPRSHAEPTPAAPAASIPELSPGQLPDAPLTPASLPPAR